MTTERGVQKSRANQVGLLMRSYRESFAREDGRRGLTQDELLRLMADVEGEYGERYSHATVSRWESGATRPSLERLKTFGTALHLQDTEIAGLILLAGLAPDFDAARECVVSPNGNGIGLHRLVDWHESEAEFDDEDGEPGAAPRFSLLNDSLRFVFLRTLPLGVGIVAGGYGLFSLGWDFTWMPVAYIAFALALVLGQGFLLADRQAGLREFFWVSIFVLLTTPLLQFTPLRMDHYNFYTLGDFAATHMPFMLALLLNLAMSSCAGLMFNLLWHWQNSGARADRSAHLRAAWTVVPPVGCVYLAVLVVSNASVWMQLGILMPVTAAMFTVLLILRDPTIDPSENDKRFAQNCALTVAVVGSGIGAVIVTLVYLMPDLPTVLPDHNLFRSWELNFDQLGYSRETAYEKLNTGYLWHAMCVFVYILFVVGGNFLVAIYGMGSRKTPTWEEDSANIAEPSLRSNGVNGDRP